MLPDGMRYASMRNVRKTRKNARVTRIALTFSQTCEGPVDFPEFPARIAATEPDALVDCFFEATSDENRVWGNCEGARPDWTRLFNLRRKHSGGYDRCFETSLVMSNMLTCPLPPNTTLSLSSALIMRRFFASCRPFFLM